MSFYINAWLDRSDPFVSLHDRQTGEAVTTFTKDELQSCLEQGDFTVSELCNPCQRVQQELVKTLLLSRCCYDVRAQLETIYQQFITPSYRVSNVIPFKARQVCQVL